MNFKGVTGEVAFDKLGRRANFTLDIIEQRQDNPPQKVDIFIWKKSIIKNRYQLDLDR